MKMYILLIMRDKTLYVDSLITGYLVCEPGLQLDLKHHNNTPRLLSIDKTTIFMPKKYISLVIKTRERG
jgi:hypothetical protein